MTTTRIEVDPTNALNAKVTMQGVWRCGNYLYKAAQGNRIVVFDISTKYNPRFCVTSEGGAIQIAAHPSNKTLREFFAHVDDINEESAATTMLPPCAEFKYGDGKSLVFDQVLTREITAALHHYRLAI